MPEEILKQAPEGRRDNIWDNKKRERIQEFLAKGIVNRGKSKRII
jgi:hypothetical protein